MNPRMKLLKQIEKCAINKKAQDSGEAIAEGILENIIDSLNMDDLEKELMEEIGPVVDQTILNG